MPQPDFGDAPCGQPMMLSEVLLGRGWHDLVRFGLSLVRADVHPRGYELRSNGSFARCLSVVFWQLSSELTLIMRIPDPIGAGVCRGRGFFVA